MIHIGITGKQGFLGSHLYNTLRLEQKKFTIIDFKREWFNDSLSMDEFVQKCDVIVHLAALNRHKDSTVMYDTNISLVKELINSFNRTNHKPHIIFSSSSQEDRDNLYGKSKRDGRELFSAFAKAKQASFTGMIIPNVFGPFGDPYYNSVVATFAHQVAQNETPKIEVNGDLKLIYVNELISVIIEQIVNKSDNHLMVVNHTATSKVSELLDKLINYKNVYQDNGEIPVLKTSFDYNLFNTFRCYMDIRNHFPVKFTQHKDDRGAFVEIIRLGIGGQVSFSTTAPGITRGNHYHTRKIERFAVIKGKALIQLRKIGTDEVLDYYLDGEEPSYVDMPIWYTHNIKNIGDDVLYTNFWINEAYDPLNADTHIQNVQLENNLKTDIL
jgi:UDP-2-acetamido-2,6-beta-L-arabino-hexul-4-ose reductase